MKQVTVIIFSLIFFAFSTYAITVAPSGYQVNYVPGTEHSFPFFVDASSEKVRIEVNGELASSYELSETEFLTDGKNHRIDVNFTVADIERPGKTSLKFKFIEDSAPKYGRKDGGGMSAVAAVIVRIDSVVPYSDKYMQIRLEDDGRVALGDKMYFKVTAESLGLKDIDKVTGKVSIYDYESKELIEEVPLTEINNFPSMSTLFMYAEWNTEGHKPGRYIINATANYDDGKKANDGGWYVLVGEKTLEILNMTPLTFPQDSITYAEIDYNSIWNEKISFYAKLLIKNEEGNAIKESTSPTTEAVQWNKGKVKLVVDTKDVKSGEHDAEVILYYDGKETKKDFKINISGDNKDVVEKVIEEPSSSFFSTTTIIIIVIIAILVAGFIIYKKRQEEEDEYEEF